MNRTKSVIALLGIAGLASFAPAANAVVILDDFTGVLGPVTAAGGPSGPKTTTLGGVANPLNVLGGYRTLTVDRTSNNAGSVSADIGLSTAQTFSFASGPSTAGKATLLYDSNGAGLGGVDIQTGAVALVGQYGSDLGANFVFSVTDTANVTSMANLIVPGTGSSSTFVGFNIPFGSLMGGANLLSVKSISLILDGSGNPETDVSLRLLSFTNPPGDVPEPGAVALLIGGALSGAVVLRRRRK